MRLIDADALRKVISDLRVIVTGVRHGRGLLCELVTEYHRNILKAIDDAPTIDAVPVVRCEDCKHFRRNLENDTYCDCVGGLTDPEENDFCSCGERRNDVHSQE